MVYDMLDKTYRGEEHVENSFPLAGIGFIALRPVTDFHDIVATRGMFNAYGNEAELEQGNIMGWEVNNITL